MNADLITAAARSLVARDPARPLRARVLDRMDRPASPRGFAWLRPALPAVAVVAVLTVVALTRFPGTGSLPAIEPAAALASERHVFASSLPIPELAPVRRPAASLRTVDLPVVASDAELAWRSAALSPLGTPSGLVVTVSQPETVTIPLLDVPAVTASGVAVAGIEPARWSGQR